MKKYQGKTVNSKAIEITVHNGKISEIKSIDSSNTLSLIGTPLIDTQNNGAIGQGFNKINENPDNLFKMKKFYQSHGVGKVLGTITTQPIEQLQKAGRTISAQFENHSDLSEFFFGFFHEGVYISKEEGWRGSHNIQFIKDPNFAEFAETNKTFGNRIKLVNIAPETPGALAFIEKAIQNDIKVAIGHCNPDTPTIKEAIKAGASFVTHFGNGSAPMLHRHKNPFWEILANDNLCVGLIADTFHLPNNFIETTLKAKGKDKCIFVSDCSSYSGLQAGEYNHHQQTLILEPNGYLHIKDKEILAGSWHQLDKAVDTLCRMGWSHSDAWQQCSDVPAKFFNIKQDKIEVGQPANFILSSFDKTRGLKLEKIIMLGEEVEASPIDPIQKNI